MTDFEANKEKQSEYFLSRRNCNSSSWTGVFILIIGSLLLAKSFGVAIPGFIFSWPMLLIAIGIFIGIKHNFQNSAWFILIIVGSVFLCKEYFLIGDFRKHVLPLVLVVIGLFFIFSPRRRRKKNRRAVSQPESYHNDETFQSKEDSINATSIFGSTKKNILSKNFRGGDITNIFGGSELNFSQADIQGTATLDITTIFGGAELIVPSHWQVKSEVTTIFGGIEDNRSIAATQHATDKVLIIRGTILFGGVDIKG